MVGLEVAWLQALCQICMRLEAMIRTMTSKIGLIKSTRYSSSYLREITLKMDSKIQRFKIKETQSLWDREADQTRFKVWAWRRISLELVEKLVMCLMLMKPRRVAITVQMWSAELNIEAQHNRKREGYYPESKLWLEERRSKTKRKRLLRRLLAL